jgi:putative membrane protein
MSKNVSVWAGVAAGFAAGLAGSLAMGLVNRALKEAMGRPPRGGLQDPAVEAASALSRAVFKRDLTMAEKEVAPAFVQFAAGGAAGALYGAVAALAPAAAGRAGLPFGAAAWVGGHLYAAPRLGIADPPMDRPLAVEAIDLVSYLVYGAVTEGVRRGLLSTLEE